MGGRPIGVDLKCQSVGQIKRKPNGRIQTFGKLPQPQPQHGINKSDNTLLL
jgi:hypothetical protein